MRSDLIDDHREIRVSHRGPRLPFQVPQTPAWVAVPAMFLVIAVMTVAAVVAVLS